MKIRVRVECISETYSEIGESVYEVYNQNEVCVDDVVFAAKKAIIGAGFSDDLVSDYFTLD